MAAFIRNQHQDRASPWTNQKKYLSLREQVKAKKYPTFAYPKSVQIQEPPVILCRMTSKMSR